jgi:hypothetical protein
LPVNVDRDGWRVGRRIVELGVLLDKLEYCVKCKRRPIALTKYSLVSELGIFFRVFFTSYAAT